MWSRCSAVSYTHEMCIRDGNYRFSSAAGIRGWSYWLDTFNVAYGPVDSNVFLSEPTVLVDERGPVR
ncbi:hypothetical protein [Streptomyces resistomycificus]|uniref:hypothetical protein n=1 Tax=Streptomyces resistomycificus TaxID=67356 RepID=UPI001CEC8DB8|nr:hypothetical protein [Streptomyces resistomycificus]